MHVERGDLVPLCDELVNTGKGREQEPQLRLTAEDDAAAARRDQRRVARELLRVAETVLGVEKDRVAIEGLPTPAGLGEVVGAGRNESDAPLVRRPAPLVIAALQEGEGAVPLWV